jgi:hypothetical protein
VSAKKRILAAVAIGLACAPLVARAQDAPDEHWYVVTISGSPVGFASETVRRGEGKILYRSHTDLSLQRMGTPLSMFMMMEEVCDEEGRFIRSRMEMDASVTGMKSSAVLDGDTLRIESESGGHVSRSAVAWQPGAISQWKSGELVTEWLEQGEGELRYTVFSPDQGDFKTMRAERGETRRERLDGVETLLRSVREYDGDGDVPVSTTWFDEDLEPVRTVIVQMGMEIVIERIEPEDMEHVELAPNFDIIRQSMIPVEGYPDPPSALEDVTIRLEMSYPLSEQRNFEGPNQREVRRGPEWVELLLSRETLNRQGMTEDPAAYLAPGRYIQSDHPDVVAIADSIRAATGAGGWELARAIAAWVHDWITGKNFEQGFASALEVLDSRAGDCTEHSVLLTALLRAAGLPARPAVGLAYADGALVGHMWTEVYVDYWRTLDALDLEGNPVRIRISGATGSRAVDERDLVAAYAIAGGMRARVVAHNAR